MKKEYLKQKRAFTLIELIITIAILIVLSTISVPLYKKHVRESKFVEGYTLLAHIRDAQLAYYNEYRNFLTGDSSTSNDEVLGINAMTNKYFTKFAVGINMRYCAAFQFVAAAFFNDELYCEYQKYSLRLLYNLTSGQTYYLGSK